MRIGSEFQSFLRFTTERYSYKACSCWKWKGKADFMSIVSIGEKYYYLFILHQLIFMHFQNEGKIGTRLIKSRRFLKNTICACFSFFCNNSTREPITLSQVLNSGFIFLAYSQLTKTYSFYRRLFSFIQNAQGQVPPTLPMED